MAMGDEDERRDDPSPSDRPALDKHERLPVGVVVARRKLDHPWQDYAWLPVAVVPGAPPAEPWTAMREEPGRTLFYAGHFELELYTREAASYRQNLGAAQPSVYVVLRHDPQANVHGLRVELVTVSPADAVAYMEPGQDIVERVPMPEPVAQWLADYVEAYFVEEKKRKRPRDRYDPNQRRIVRPPGPSENEGGHGA